jgi:hypothetical protein
MFFSFLVFLKRERDREKKKNKWRKPQTTVLSPLPFRVMTTLCAAAGAPVLCLSQLLRDVPGVLHRRRFSLLHTAQNIQT